VNGALESDAASNSHTTKRKLREEPASSSDEVLLNSDEMSDPVVRAKQTPDTKLARNYSQSTAETAGDEEDEDYLFDEYREWNLSQKLEALNKYTSEFVVFVDAKSKIFNFARKSINYIMNIWVRVFFFSGL
jgi:hypothetical protein